MIAAAEKVQTIELIQPGLFKSLYEFRTDGKKVGELRYFGFGHKRAEATIFNQEWKLQHTGFWKPMLEFKASQSPYEKGKIKASMSCASEYVSHEDKKYTFKKQAWWKTCWSWYDESGKELMKFSDTFSMKKQARILLFNESLQNKPILLLLGSALLLVQKRAAFVAH